MPARRRGIARFEHALTGPEAWELKIGPRWKVYKKAGSWMRDESSVFASDDERRAAWEIHREALLAEQPKGTLPWAYRQYETTERAD